LVQKLVQWWVQASDHRWDLVLASVLLEEVSAFAMVLVPLKAASTWENGLLIVSEAMMALGSVEGSLLSWLRLVLVNMEAVGQDTVEHPPVAILSDPHTVVVLSLQDNLRQEHAAQM
jgi:hypothetical protein